MRNEKIATGDETNTQRKTGNGNKHPTQRKKRQCEKKRNIQRIKCREQKIYSERVQKENGLDKRKRHRMG